MYLFVLGFALKAFRELMIDCGVSKIKKREREEDK